MRIGVSTLATLLVVSGAPAGGAGAQVPTGGFCGDAARSDGFTDVADNDPNVANITCLTASGITRGVTPTTFAPAAPVTRRQMALFVKRLVDTANRLEIADLQALPSPPAGAAFPDLLPESAEVRDAVGQLEAAGIIDGKPDGTYGPGDLVSQAQMAKFIVNAFELLIGEELPAGSDAFVDDDDDDDSVFERFINKLADAGMVVGQSSGISTLVVGCCVARWRRS